MKWQDSCGEEEKFFLLAETVDFFSSTLVLVQLDISDRTEFWNVMLNKKKTPQYSVSPEIEQGLVSTICSNYIGYMYLQVTAVAFQNLLVNLISNVSWK